MATISARDQRILDFVGRQKSCPVDVIAELFFQQNGKTDAVNKNAYHAARRAIYELRVRGLVRSLPHRDASGRDCALIELTPQGARAIGLPLPGAVHRKALVHHIETLRFVAPLLKGHPDASLELEHHLRQALQAGGSKRGKTLPPLPDAVVTTASGESIGVEYVSGKYSDAMILEKIEAMRQYDRALFVAENSATQRRVTALTGMPCEVVR